MKKICVLVMLMVFTIVAVGQDKPVNPPEEKVIKTVKVKKDYFEKELKMDTGYSPTVWQVDSIEINMGEKPSATVRLVGYKDEISMLAGNGIAGRKNVRIESIDVAIKSYPVIFEEVVAKLVGEGEFKDAELKSVTVDKVVDEMMPHP